MDNPAMKTKKEATLDFSKISKHAFCSIPELSDNKGYKLIVTDNKGDRLRIQQFPPPGGRYRRRKNDGKDNPKDWKHG